MADLLERRHLRELIEHRSAECVSITLPTHRTWPASDTDRIRLKNLLGEARARLLAGGALDIDADQLLEPGRALVDEHAFWKHQSDGLALFLAPSWVRIFRLPIELTELVVVAGRFQVKPLIELLSADRRFFVLAISQNAVRLLEGSRQRVDDVELLEVPQGLREALHSDERERELQFHVTGRGGQGARAVFHGHGAGGEVDKGLVEQYLRMVDDGLSDVLRDERAPMILAGVGYERAIFRAITRYPFVLEAGIDGSPDRLRLDQLHERAWAIVEPHLRRDNEAAAGRCRAALGRGTGAVTDVEDVLHAALDGRVDSLFVEVGQQRWGTVDAATHGIATHDRQESGTEDLVDRAAVETLARGGAVFTVQPDGMPGPGPVAAHLRF